MNTRKQLAAALAKELPETIRVVDDVRELGELDPTYTGCLQLIRTNVTPDTRVGGSWHEFELWVIDPLKDPEVVEDHLDDNLDLVLNILDELTWLTWSSAARDTHPSDYHAYRITLRVSGTNN